MRFFSLTKCVFLIGAALLVSATGRAESLPFEPGEKLFYEVRWEQIPVAQVSLEVQPFEQIQGEQAFHFVFRARTYPAVEILYPVDGRIDAFTDLAVTRSLRLEKNMLEGRSQKIYWVDFDWNRNIAKYENEKQKKRRIPLSAGTLDIVSILYHARALPLETGMKVSRQLNSGKKTLHANAQVVRRETVMVGGRPWPAFLIEPDVRKAGGVFKKSKNAKLYLWLSADQRKIPLKVVSKVRIGHFTIELIDAPTGPDRLSYGPVSAGS